MGNTIYLGVVGRGGGGGVNALRDMSSPEGKKIWKQVAQAGDALPEWLQEHIKKAAIESVRGERTRVTRCKDCEYWEKHSRFWGLCKRGIVETKPFKEGHAFLFVGFDWKMEAMTESETFEAVHTARYFGCVEGEDRDG